jgi:hypothetical protein
MMAALKGNTAIVDLLLEHKADVNQRNILGQSALDIAVAMGHGQVLQILQSDNHHHNDLQILQSDNYHHSEVENALPDLVTGIAVQKTWETETYVSTEKNEALAQIPTRQLEESQIRYTTPQHTTKICHNLCQSDTLFPSFQFTEPQTNTSSDTNEVPVSAACSSFSLQNSDMMSATYTPKIEYCSPCSSCHLSNSSHCLKNKSSNISKLDVPVPLHNMCISGSVITKLQKQADKPTEHVSQPFIPFMNNVAVPSRIRAIRSLGSNISPQDNKKIGHSMAQAYNLKVRAISPQSNTNRIHNIYRPNIEARDILPMENNYKFVDIPQSLLQPCVSTEHTYFQNERDLSPQTNTHICYGATHDYNCPSRAHATSKNIELHSLQNTALSPQTNIQIDHGTTRVYNLPSKGISPLRNTEAYSLADKALSPQNHSQVGHDTTHAYKITGKGPPSPSNTKPYSLHDRTHSLQTSAQMGHGTMQAYNVPSGGLSPINNTGPYSLADRAHYPQTSAHMGHGTMQAYKVPSGGLSPISNTDPYSLDDRAHYPQSSGEICHGTTHAYNLSSKGPSPVSNTVSPSSRQSTFSSN